jgi:hypothetical protein
MVCEHFVMCYSVNQPCSDKYILNLFMLLLLGLKDLVADHNSCLEWSIVVYASFIHHQDTNAPHAGIFVEATAKFLQKKLWIFFLSYCLPSEILLVVALYLEIQL